MFRLQMMETESATKQRAGYLTCFTAVRIRLQTAGEIAG